jgi:hypothetical protein
LSLNSPPNNLSLNLGFFKFKINENQCKLGEEIKDLTRARAHKEQKITELYSNYSGLVKPLLWVIFLYPHNCMLWDCHKAVHGY